MNLSTMKYHIIPFGCQMNRSDTERIRTVLDSMGYVETPRDDESGTVIKGIVSCSVRQKAIDRVYGKIRKWNAAKTAAPLITFVSGCVLPADREKFLKLFDLVFPIEELHALPDMIRHYGVPTPESLSPSIALEPPPDPPAESAAHPAPFQALTHQSPASPETCGGPQVTPPIPRQPVRQPAPAEPNILTGLLEAKNLHDPAKRGEAHRRIEAFWQVKPRYTSKVEAYIPIQNGCDKFCTFCAVPYTRGREVSRPSGAILDEVRALIQNGCRSITLLGQNVNSYGLDRPNQEISFPELMRRIGGIGRETGADFLTYFTSPHPRDITTELLEVIAEHPVLAKWIHLPLQSGDDKVLLRMNRNHTMARYRSVVSRIRRILPDAALFTDIIVGFTGETETQFQATAAAMREFRYDMAYIAQYSPRPGARSARWADDVPRHEKQRRFQILSDLLLEVAAPANQARIGRIIRVLVTSEGRKPGFLTAHTEGRIPVRIQADPGLIGEFVDIQVTGARPLSIEGALARPAAV